MELSNEYLEQRQIESMEAGKVHTFEEGLPGLQKKYLDSITDFYVAYGSDNWKNGYCVGFADAMKGLEMLEKVCEELAGNEKVPKVPLLSGGKLIMYCMEMFGYRINTDGKYERR